MLQEKKVLRNILDNIVKRDTNRTQESFLFTFVLHIIRDNLIYINLITI